MWWREVNRPPVDRANAVAKGLLLAVALSFLGMFASDYAWLEYRMGHDTAGPAFGSVTFYYATPLKNGRTEIFYDQPQTEVCVLALFPHAGYRPCWAQEPGVNRLRASSSSRLAARACS